MSIEWNERQKDAIVSRNGTVLVSAAAGSGKSAVLVERVIERLCDEENKCSADRLMIVTFTNAAASGLRHKINKALSEKIKENPNSKYLVKQQRLLSSAVIGTMDSFCGSLVRENYFLCDIDPDFRILDNAQEKILKSNAIDTVLEKYYTEKEQSFIDLLELFGSDKNDYTLIENVDKCYEYAIAYPTPEKWIDSLISEYDSSVKITDSASGRAVMNDLLLRFNKYIEVLETAKGFCVGIDLLEEKYIPIIEENLSLCMRLLSLCENGEWDLLRNELYDVSKYFKSMPSIREPEVKDLYEKSQAQSMRNSVKKALVGLYSQMPVSQEQYRRDCDSLRPALCCYASIVKEYYYELLRLKKEENAYSFSDISHTALQLLIDENGNKTPLAKELTERFVEILIDEYQDTNEAQDRLFTAISRDSNNLFIVGDVKQSIYRFRKAMPEIFIKRRDGYGKYDRKKDNYPSKIFLDSNYRSRKDVIDTVNFVFSRIMNKKTGDIEYNEDEFLNFKADYDEKSVPCEIHFLKKDENGEMISEEQHVANQIKQMVDSRFQIKEDGVYRDIRYSDICILLRSVSKHGQGFVSALNKMGIPAFSDSNESFCDQYEIAVILSLLKTVDNPLDDLSLLTTLYSPMYGFTPDELAEIRLEGDDKHLYSCLKKYASHNEKAKRFLEEISEFKQYSVIYPTSEMLLRIYEQTSFDDIVRTMLEGDKRADNLIHLAEFAQSFEEKGSFGLAEFIRFVSRVTESGGDIPSDSSRGNTSNSVRIMTIHKSKGLEFPVVFIPKCNYNPRETETNKALVKLNSKTKLGVMRHDRDKLYRYNTLQYAGTKIQNKYDDVSEKLRVLYVAMTRAREKMIFVIPDGNAKYRFNMSNVISSLLYNGAPNAIDIIDRDVFSNWILSMAFISSGCEQLRRETGALIDSSFIKKADFLTFKSFLPEKQEENEPSVQDEEKQPDRAFVNELESRINYVYPYKALTTVAAKRTASGFNEETVNDEFFANEKPAFMGKQSFTPAQRGTLTHLFMEKCDFSLAFKNVKEEIERLVSDGVFTPEQAKAVNEKALEKFFKSFLYERIRNSTDVYREQQFTVSLPASFFENELQTEEQVVVQGKIDCFFIENDKAVIVDYKTDRVTDGEELKDRYFTQMIIYKQAVEQFTDKKVNEVLLYSFSLDEAVKCI